MRPLLAATLHNPEDLSYPVLLSPKYDGIRALKFGPHVVSRNLKPIRNKYVQEKLKHIPEGVDGELIVGPPNEGLVFNRTSSGVMSGDGQPNFKYYVFDLWNSSDRFQDRFDNLKEQVDGHPFIEIVPQLLVYSKQVFELFEDSCIKNGFEGVMVRGPDSRYKFGRATHNDQALWKYKRFRDGEAVIEGLEEQERNLNEATIDALGYTTRSSHQDNMVGASMVGALLCRDIHTDEPIRVSAGKMDHMDRVYFWAHPEKIVGKIAKYKTFDYGKVNTPRFCTFQGFRDPDDV